MTPTALRNDFARTVAEVDANASVPGRVETLMLNVGLRCDLACAHCHHACSPARVEVMARETLRAAISFAEELRPELVDVTGGEPVLYPHLRDLLGLARAARLPLRVRTNLVALARPEAADLPALFAHTRTRVLASLPGGSAGDIADAPGRASATWDRAIASLSTLASLGYGRRGGDAGDSKDGNAEDGDGLTLDLAHNPAYGELPRPQAELEAEFRAALLPFGVRFDRLLTITNVPVGRLRERLAACGCADQYSALLRDAFNPAVVPELECRRGLEIAWDGTLWDCDFNLAARLPPTAGPLTLADLADHPSALVSRRIAFGPHCFACTAGAGSS